MTQVRTLDRAEQQVRDLVETMTGEDASAAEVAVNVPDLEEYRARVADAQRAAAHAAQQARDAALELRAVVKELRTQKHLSVSDVATVLGVSQGRVSQLMKG